MKRIGILLGGGALLLVGIALLVLPGPGFLLIFGGLVVLSTEFAWARKYVDLARDKAQQGVDEVSKSLWRTIFAAVFALGMMAVGAVVFLGVEIPFVNRFTGGVLIVSGLFLLGTLVYARRTANSGKTPPSLRTADQARAKVLKDCSDGAPTKTRAMPGLPVDYIEVFQAVGPAVIDHDFALTAPGDVEPDEFGLVLFATTAAKDRWQFDLSGSSPTVRFAEHRAAGPGTDLRIGFQDWLRLAVFARDMEAWRSRNTGEGVVVDLTDFLHDQLSTISPGLARRFPAERLILH